jgi:hypothetical protein
VRQATDPSGLIAELDTGAPAAVRERMYTHRLGTPTRLTAEEVEFMQSRTATQKIRELGCNEQSAGRRDEDVPRLRADTGADTRAVRT